MPRFTAFDGADLFYDVVGDDHLPPLLVIAGGPGRDPLYLGRLGPLQQRYRFVVPHLRGVGLSAASDGRPFTELASDIEALRIHLALPRMRVIAHSSGARVALVHASRHPDVVERMVLVTPAASWLTDTADDTEAIIDRRARERWFARYREAREQYARAGSWTERNSLYPAIAPISWARWDETAERHERIGAWHTRGQEHFFGPVDTDAVRTGLGRLAGQVLIIAGGEDGLSGVDGPVALAASFPHGEAAVIEDAGHYPWVESPAAFSVAVRSIL